MVPNMNTSLLTAAQVQSSLCYKHNLMNRTLFLMKHFREMATMPRRSTAIWDEQLPVQDTILFEITVYGIAIQDFKYRGRPLKIFSPSH